MRFLHSLTKKNLAGKVCLVRVDLNISEGELRGKKNHLRILAILPTIKFLLRNGAKVVLLSHRGRPASKKLKAASDKQFSLQPFAKILEKLLGEKVVFIDLSTLSSPRKRGSSVNFLDSRMYGNDNKISSDFKNYFEKAGAIINDSALACESSGESKIFLLENLRFFEGEEKNERIFAKQLAELGDLYVNDAFAVCHRKAASIVVITKFLPSYAGLLLENEIKNLDRARSAPPKAGRSARPLIIVLGGAKISDKIGLIKNFIKRADYFLLGGGITNTFFAAQGLPMGNSLYEKEMVGFARKMSESPEIILPIDSTWHKNRILDIGPNTAALYSDIIKKAKTIIWNGPMGYFEDKRFAKGSEAIARAIIKNKKAFAVIGGGETTAAFQAVNHKPQTANHKHIFISTGGGAMLEYLAGKKLPGIEALKH